MYMYIYIYICMHNGPAVEEVTKEGSHSIVEVFREHRETWKNHWAGTEGPFPWDATVLEESYDIPGKPVCRKSNNWQANTKLRPLR